MNSYLPEGEILRDFKNMEYINSREGLIRAYERQVILEAPAILCDRDFNLHVSLGAHVHAKIPREECELTRGGEEIKDIAILTRVGKPVCFKIIALSKDEAGELHLTLSRREAQLECASHYIRTLIPGDVISGKVTHVESFGAFVDIGCGIISLLPIDMISVSRISHPAERLEAGMSIYCVVKAIDELGRIFVSMKELLGTWCENASMFSEGQTVRGVVRGVEGYGIFIELAPNLAGLAEYKEGISESEIAAVYIKSIIPDKMKVKLIIIDSCEGSKAGEIKYFITPKSHPHIDNWTYSPEGARKLIYSTF
ncbi:MAG: S1 RNA-binding domain-containing protein [Clostridia bacterium]|nr:S1 RNA-binding domain-containing protein [Clostridia bacterium]MBQ8290340.1 S1 RNA-binding domain-containing protein [Clostridia bacterium]